MNAYHVEWRYRLLELAITENLRETGMKYIDSCLRMLRESFAEKRYLVDEKEDTKSLQALNFELCIILYRRKKIEIFNADKIVNDKQ